MFLKKHYPFLRSTLLNWCKEGEKPPLFIFPLGEEEWKKNQSEIFAYLLGHEDGVLSDRNSLESEVILLVRSVGKNSISIKETRSFIRDLSLSSSSRSFKIGIIPNVRALNLESQNALLKTMEEPRKNRYLILFGNSREEILPTLISRSIQFNLTRKENLLITEYLTNNFPHLKNEEIVKIYFWSQGNINLASKMADNFTYYENIFDLFQNLSSLSPTQKISWAKDWIKNSQNEVIDLLEIFTLENYSKLKEAYEKEDTKGCKKLIKKIQKTLDYTSQAKKSNPSGNPELLLEAYLLNV